MTEILLNEKKNISVKMNEDLEDWLNDSSKKSSEDRESIHTLKKKPTGKCKICGTHPATAVCVKCEKPVCNSHYYHIIGVCEKCLSKETVEKWKKHNPNWKKLLGVDWLD